MNVLLDECVDHRLGKELRDQNVRTVPRMGCSGKKNGELLALAQQQFDVFITTDQNIFFQQNLRRFDLAVLILHAGTNRLADLKPLIPEILLALPTVKSGRVLHIASQ
ncbi:hypothetical protein EDS67_19895 [candidate division KSB1 bacterium]|nr:MAG: hypothetical protein EDS67_19895 [candidate division KSB1 bacterium]MBC6947506.1 hypothetical protein [candidate division KSB1 bacterium]MCE7945042.1 hypothetical protein [Chlorobi bacterium CHB1]MDL1876381.1 hypothetical protein [Cytophagia bacterium CHB2]